MINWDYMITYGGPELFVGFVLFVITPIIYWLILKHFKWLIKITSIASLWIAAIFIAYWDVYQISREAERLCRDEAGLHVYKTVEAEGFVGVTDIEYWSQYGFLYVENETIIGGKKRYSIQDGDVVKEKVNSFISDYEYIQKREVVDKSFSRGRLLIENRKTKEVLGEIISFGIYPGWLDRRLLGVLSFTWSPASCDGDYPPKPQKSTLFIIDLVSGVINLKKSSQGEML